MLVPVSIYVMTMFGLSLNLAILIALVVLISATWYFDFSAVMALMTPVILIGGMTMGWFNAHGSGSCSGSLVALPRSRSLPHDDPQDTGEGNLRHDRNHGIGSVYRGAASVFACF